MPKIFLLSMFSSTVIKILIKYWKQIKIHFYNRSTIEKNQAMFTTNSLEAADICSHDFITENLPIASWNSI